MHFPRSRRCLRDRNIHTSLGAILIGSGLCLLAASGLAREEAPAALAEASVWAASHAIPFATWEPRSGFADLQPLKKIIGTSRVVAFGEGMHATHEYLAFRNRLFEFLVERMGFTSIAAETGYTESIAADDYVLGRRADRREAAGAVFSWASAPSAENAQLLDW